MGLINLGSSDFLWLKMIVRSSQAAWIQVSSSLQMTIREIFLSCRIFGFNSPLRISLRIL